VVLNPVKPFLFTAFAPNVRLLLPYLNFGRENVQLLMVFVSI